MPNSERAVGLSMTFDDVREAIDVINNVLVVDGFVRLEKSEMQGVPGFVAEYARYESGGFKSYVLPDIYVRKTRIEIHITELGNRSNQAGTITRHLCDEFQRVLGNRYGRGRVRVQLRR